MEVFWRLGYESASLSELTGAIGINAPSFYAAFGSKEALFQEAVALYQTGVGSGTARAIAEQPTARAAIATILRDAVQLFTDGSSPPGCLIVLGTMNCSPASKGAQEHLLVLRRRTQDIIRERLERGIAEGDVPASANVSAMTSFYTTVLHGLSIQARDGDSRATLTDVADCAMSAWDGLAGASKR
ncbi:TetR family transcriptional regulator [Capsulimonas corticalis]|uniref:TetR family transcriptional regulator n=1 Tax=Capsulimonas corticalis TaxID=2219043 RepID=A0A402CUX9_9BACT|nr:TetR/AcrR family transcriptional regulator [Capsulimonas corticalis]BDI30209.1 TetR family transcriptional regulator [Capsulimonas corticalis]